jgi:L-alanine-DL-glutamate epimerase-like enolase superfamily enzyme
VSLRLTKLSFHPITTPLTESFGIAGGTQELAANVYVRAQLSNGTHGWGEAAPFPAFDGQTQAGTLKVLQRCARQLIGLPAGAYLQLEQHLQHLIPRHSCARAAVEMAVLDAWTKSRGLPLYALFGGTTTHLQTDITIPVVTPDHAAASARRIRERGVKTLKIKVGTTVRKDTERVCAALDAFPKAKLILDANGGFTPSQSLDLLRRLKRRGVTVTLFEQPARSRDLRGLRKVSRQTLVAADESVTSAADVARIARLGAAAVVNVKLMKSGVIGAWRIATTARAAGLRLMIGGLVESRLSMACAAHLACGIGGFDFVDLDTPLFLAKDPTHGVPISTNGTYDLSGVTRGIGVRPARA